MLCRDCLQWNHRIILRVWGCESEGVHSMPMYAWLLEGVTMMQVEVSLSRSSSIAEDSIFSYRASVSLWNRLISEVKCMEIAEYLIKTCKNCVDSDGKPWKSNDFSMGNDSNWVNAEYLLRNVWCCECEVMRACVSDWWCRVRSGRRFAPPSLLSCSAVAEAGWG